MATFLRQGTLTCEAVTETVEPGAPPLPTDTTLLGDIDAKFVTQPVPPRSPPRVGATPYHIGMWPSPSGRCLGGRNASSPTRRRAPSPPRTAPETTATLRRMPVLDHGPLHSPLRGSPPLGDPFGQRIDALAAFAPRAPPPARDLASSPKSVLETPMEMLLRRAAC